MRAQSRPHIHGSTVADADRSQDELSVVELRYPDRRILRQRHVIADRQQVPAATRQIHAPVDLDAPADACPQSSEHGGLQGGALQEPPGDPLRGADDDPVPRKETAPNRRLYRLVTPDQQPLDEHRQRDAARCVDHQSEDAQQRSRQRQDGRAEVAKQEWQELKHQQVQGRAERDQAGGQPQTLDGRGQNRPTLRSRHRRKS